MSRNSALIIIGAVILCFAGLNNKFPLLLPDSGAYVHAGFTRQVPFDRTALYGLFVAHASWGRSLWLVIFSQALLLSLVLYYYFSYFSAHRHYIVPYLACLFFIGFFMLGSVTVSTIGAGIFASISILCGGLLLFADNLRKRDVYIIVFMLVLSAAMDLQYLATLTFIALGYAIGLLLFKTRVFIKTTGRRIALVAALTLAAGVWVSAIHFMLGGGFGVVRDHNIALVPRLAGAGFYNLDTLITPGGRFVRAALTNDEQQAFREKAQDITSQPYFWQDFAKQTVPVFFHQLISVQTGKDIVSGSFKGETAKSIFSWYNEDVRECSITRQAGGWLHFQYQNYGQCLTAIGFFFFFAWAIVRQATSRHISLFTYVFIVYLINALVGAVLYGQGHMQGQIAWIVAIPMFLFAAEVNDLKQ